MAKLRTLRRIMFWDGPRNNENSAQTVVRVIGNLFRTTVSSFMLVAVVVGLGFVLVQFTDDNRQAKKSVVVTARYAAEEPRLLTDDELFGPEAVSPLDTPQSEDGQQGSTSARPVPEQAQQELERLETALRNAHRDGDQEAARRLAAAIRARRADLPSDFVLDPPQVEDSQQERPDPNFAQFGERMTSDRILTDEEFMGGELPQGFRIVSCPYSHAVLVEIKNEGRRPITNISVEIDGRPPNRSSSVFRAGGPRRVFFDTIVEPGSTWSNCISVPLNWPTASQAIWSAKVTSAERWRGD